MRTQESGLKGKERRDDEQRTCKRWGCGVTKAVQAEEGLTWGSGRGRSAWERESDNIKKQPAGKKRQLREEHRREAKEKKKGRRQGRKGPQTELSSQEDGKGW